MRASLRIGVTSLAVSAAMLLGGGMAFAADPVEGSHAVPDQIGLMPAATQHMQEIHDFHNLLLVIITGISVFVLGLLLWVMIRYNARANPKPAMWSHHFLIEVIWTAVPVVILVLIAIPSFRLLYAGEVIPANVDLTIKAIGHQWNWSYEYPDHGVGIELAEMATKEEAEAQGEPRLLAVKPGGRVFVPVGKVVRVIVTSTDVIHAWTVPAFGVKIDAVPGKLNEIWFKVEREGVFYGQCSELCGTNHAFMPIAVEVVSQEKFDAWVAQKKSGTAQSTAPAASLAAR